MGLGGIVLRQCRSHFTGYSASAVRVHSRQSKVHSRHTRLHQWQIHREAVGAIAPARVVSEEFLGNQFSNL